MGEEERRSERGNGMKEDGEGDDSGVESAEDEISRCSVVIYHVLKQRESVERKEEREREREGGGKVFNELVKR